MVGAFFYVHVGEMEERGRGYTCVQTDKRHCLKAFFLFLFTTLPRRVRVWSGGVKCTLLMRQQEETQRYRAGGVDSSGLGKWSSMFSSVSNSPGAGRPSRPLSAVSPRLIVIMDDPWWQRQVKPSHM